MSKHPWPDGLVLVCRECGGPESRAIAKSLRRLVRARVGKGVRVVPSGCLDVCPKRGVTVGVLVKGQTCCIVVKDPAEAESKVGRLLSS